MQIHWTNESVCIRKEFNSQRNGLVHQHGSRFIVLGHQYGRRDVMWKLSIGFIYALSGPLHSKVFSLSLVPDPLYFLHFSLTAHSQNCVTIVTSINANKKRDGWNQDEASRNSHSTVVYFLICLWVKARLELTFLHLPTQNDREQDYSLYDICCIFI